MRDYDDVSLVYHNKHKHKEMDEAFKQALSEVSDINTSIQDLISHVNAFKVKAERSFGSRLLKKRDELLKVLAKEMQLLKKQHKNTLLIEKQYVALKLLRFDQINTLEIDMAYVSKAFEILYSDGYYENLKV